MNTLGSMAIPERAEESVRADAPSTPPLDGPIWRGDHPVWAASAGPVEVRFVGRGLGGTRAAILRRVEGREIPVAEAKQVHSDGVLAVSPDGVAGGDDLYDGLHDERGGERSGQVEGDALWTDVPGIALSVITADCVPVLLAERGGDRIAAVHAGWRGLIAGVIPRALETLGARPESLDAWIGPAIGVCCYEVGDDVAAAVVGAAAPHVMRSTPERPHLDLTAAARHQLETAGVEAIRTVGACTHCDPERLWSYRREGPGGGRNVAYVWRTT